MKTLHVVSAIMLVLGASACASGGAPGRQVIMPPNTTPAAPYSPGVRSGGFVFISGTLGTRPGTRELAQGGINAETRQALENLRTTLRAADLDFRDVVKCTVFLADIRDYDAMNTVYGEFFRDSPPARSAVGVNGLPLSARVEIECIAFAG
jgi:2-iminobutanoate/2-iminopropanoate deaminase